MKSDRQVRSSDQVGVIPVILCGGAGSRLWPMSRSELPKPFIKLDDGQSLLQKAFLRASSMDQVSEIVTICNHKLLSKIRDEYNSINNKKIETSFILEPFGRNTAPAIAVAASYISKQHSDQTIMLILAADHLIDDISTFRKAVQQAEKLALKGKLVTFGIPPNSPETGYGYIEYDGYSVVNFVEKPTIDTAREYLDSGRFLWNSGMFCFTAESVINEMKMLCPNLLNATTHCMDKSKRGNSEATYEISLNSESFQLVEDISFDYAVMEKTGKASVIHSDIGWSDIGDWKALGNLAEPDADNNRLRGRIIQKNSHNTTVISENRTIGAIGLENLIVVDTPDALLISNKDETQNVRDIYSQLDRENDPTTREHKKHEYSWGVSVKLEENDDHTIQKMIINPNEEILIPNKDLKIYNFMSLKGDITVSAKESTQSISQNGSISLSSESDITIRNLSGGTAIVMVVKSA